MPLWTCILLLCVCFTASAVTLNEAFRKALEKNESFQTEQSKMEVADEQVLQGWGSVFPKVSLIGNYSRQDASGNFPSSATNQPESTTAKLYATQPLFHGLSDVFEIRSRRAKLRASKANVQYQKMKLYQSVAESFYKVLSSETDLQNVKTLRELSSKRVAQLKERARIGRSRKGELLAAQAQVATLDAQVESLEAELMEAKEQLQIVTSLASATKLDPPPITKVPSPRPLAELEKSLVQRPDLVSKREEADAAHETVSAYWGQHLPSLDLTANYYLRRPDVLSDVKWDFGIQLTVPLFYGGVIQSQIREVSEKRKQADLALGLAEKTALKELKTAHVSVVRLLAQQRSLESAVQISEANYKEQNKDYSLGLVTNLDVISALNQLYETRRLLDKARYKIPVAQITLEIAAGLWKEPS